MMPQVVTVTSVAASPWIPLNYHQTPFNVGFGVVISAGTATYTVQHTFDNVFDPTVTPVAFDNASSTAQTANDDGNYAFPVRAVRLNVTAAAGATVTMTLLQGR